MHIWNNTITREDALFAGAVVVLLLGLSIWSAIRKYRLRKERDFTRTLETLLLPKEQVKAICPQHGGWWILTNKRLIIREGGSYTALPFRKIHKLRGQDELGKTTAAPAKMARLFLLSEKEHILKRENVAFTDFVKQLKAAVQRSKPKKKPGKRK